MQNEECATLKVEHEQSTLQEKCSMKIVQHEKSLTWKSATWIKCNRKSVQHEKSVPWKRDIVKYGKLQRNSAL